MPLSNVDILLIGDSTMAGMTCLSGTFCIRTAEEQQVMTDPAGLQPTVNDWGHDILKGTGAYYVSPYRYATCIQQVMDQELINPATGKLMGGGVVRVEDRSVPGADAVNCIDGTNILNADGSVAIYLYAKPSPTATNGSLGGTVNGLPSIIARSHARIGCANFGINDAFRRSPTQYRQDLDTLIGTIGGVRNADGLFMVPVLIEPNPICVNDNLATGNQDFSPYLDAMHAACAAANVLCIPQHDRIKGGYPNNSWVPLLADSIHPVPSLYQNMGEFAARTLFQTVQQVLQAG